MIYKLSLSLLFAFLIEFTQIVLCEEVQNDTERKLSSAPFPYIKTEFLEKRAANETKDKNDDMEIDPSELINFLNTNLDKQFFFL